jgi:hypothetical protein
MATKSLKPVFHKVESKSREISEDRALQIAEKIVRLMEVGDLGGHVGFGGRTDNTGIRSKGVDRKPDRRLKDFPYDRDITYGNPGKKDRGSSVSTMHRGAPITPKDDEHFSLSIMDLEELVKEIMGSPILLSRGGSSQLGSMVPGVNGGWANNPPKDWDDEDEDTSRWYDNTSLGELEGPERALVDPEHYGEFDFHQIAPDPWTTINHALSSRGLQGRLPRESAWDRISGMTLEPRNSED